MVVIDLEFSIDVIFLSSFKSSPSSIIARKEQCKISSVLASCSLENAEINLLVGSIEVTLYVCQRKYTHHL